MENNELTLHHNISISKPKKVVMSIQNNIGVKKTKMSSDYYSNSLSKNFNDKKNLSDFTNDLNLNNFKVKAEELKKVTGEKIKENLNRHSISMSKENSSNLNLRLLTHQPVIPNKWGIEYKDEFKTDNLSTDPSYNSIFDVNQVLKPIRHKCIDRLDNKIENQNYKLKVMNSDNNLYMLDHFLFRGKKSTMFYSNNIDNMFSRTNYSNSTSNNKFFTKYAMHREFVRKNVIKKETPTFTFIKEIKSKNRIPNPLGLIKKNGDERDLNLNNHGTGDEYVNIIAKSIINSELDHVEFLNLKQNCISLNGLESMLSTLQINPKTVKNIRKIDLSNNPLTSGSATYIVKYISTNCFLKKLYLENTTLNDEAVIKITQAIISNIVDDIQCINFGGNSLTDDSIQILCELIEKGESLKSIELQSNCFTNEGAASIIDSITKNREIANLNLSHNKLGDRLKLNPSREEVYKNSNPTRSVFRNFDLVEFTQTMKFGFKDIRLPEVDDSKKKIKGNKLDFFACLKYQSKVIIPEKEISQFTLALGQMFQEKKSALKHLDISHNNLNYRDCKHIEETVKANHTIYGIHVDGNDMIIDELGFIFALDPSKREVDYYASAQITYDTLLENDKNLIGNNLQKTKINDLKKIRGKNNCWICGNWKETEFIFYPIATSQVNNINEVNENLEGKEDNQNLENNEYLNTMSNNNLDEISDTKISNTLTKVVEAEKDKDKKDKNPVCKLFLNFEKFKGQEMIYRVKDNKAYCHRMCPPGILNFFYTVDDKVEITEDLTETLINPIKIKLETQEFPTSPLRNTNKLNSFRSTTLSNLSKDKQTQNLVTQGSLFRQTLAVTKNSNTSISGIIDTKFKKSMLNLNKKFVTNILETANELLVNKVIKREISQNDKNIDENWYSHIFYCVPRPEKIEEIENRVRTPWSFPISIWSRQFNYLYEGEPDEAYYCAFDFDFNRCKFEKDMKKDIASIDELKAYLWNYYKRILILYKNISSFSGLSIWQITQSAFLELMNKCNNLFDSYSKDFMLLKVEGVKQAENEEKKKKNKNVPENIIRHQLLNILVKISIDKYVNKRKFLNIQYLNLNMRSIQ